MIKNKRIILPFLFLAWAIIFAHSIIPHHHHDKGAIECCTKCNVQGFFADKEVQVWDADHNHSEHVCQYKVETLTHGSIDKIFIVNTENDFLRSVRLDEANIPAYYYEFVSYHIPWTKFLRGPPACIISQT